LFTIFAVLYPPIPSISKPWQIEIHRRKMPKWNGRRV
jgi:hypothetical protein